MANKQQMRLMLSDTGEKRFARNQTWSSASSTEPIFSWASMAFQSQICHTCSHNHQIWERLTMVVKGAGNLWVCARAHTHAKTHRQTDDHRQTCAHAWQNKFHIMNAQSWTFEIPGSRVWRPQQTPFGMKTVYSARRVRLDRIKKHVYVRQPSHTYLTHTCTHMHASRT